MDKKTIREISEFIEQPPLYPDKCSKCAEWEKVWDFILTELKSLGSYATSIERGLIATMGKLDPRRKPEPKPNWFVAEDFGGRDGATG